MPEKDIPLRRRLVAFYNEEKTTLDAREKRIAAIEEALDTQDVVTEADAVRFQIDRADSAGRAHILGGLAAILATEDISPNDITGE